MSTNSIDLGIELIEVEDLAGWLRVERKTIQNLISAKRKGRRGISDKFYIKAGKKILFVKSKVTEAILAGTFIA